MDLAADAAAFFEDLAETITYRPASRPPRQIRALVNRLEAGPAQPLGLASAQATIAVQNSPEGIELEALDLAADSVDLAIREGNQATRRAILAVVSQDAGILTLEVG